MGSMKSVLAAVAMVAVGLMTAAGLGATESVTSAATVESCVASQITVSHAPPQGTAGTTFVPIIFTNTGAKCAIWGVPAVHPVTGSAHHAVGPAACSLSMGEVPVRRPLAKGRSVSVAFGVTDTGNFTPSSCVVRSANGVIITRLLRPLNVRAPADNGLHQALEHHDQTDRAGVNGY